jgi:PAS domain S-box-containing protein
VHPGDRDALARAYEHSVEHRTQYDFVHRIVMPDGRVKWLHERGRTLYGDGGEPIRTIGTVQDITDRKRLEDRLQHAQHLAKIGAWEIGPTGTTCWWSDETFRIIGANLQSTQPSWDVYVAAAHPEDRELVEQARRNALRGQAPFMFAHRLKLHDGSIKHVLIQGHPSGDGVAPSTMWEGTIQDTTDQVRSEKRMRDVLDGIVAFVAVFAIDGTVVDINRAPLEAAGLRHHEVVGKRFCEAYWWSYDPAVTQEVRTIVARAACGETIRTDLTARISADQFAIVDAVFSPLRGAGGEVEAVIASAVDVTQRVRALAAWKESDERLRLVIAASGQGIWTMDLDPMVARFSPEHARLLGYEPSELVWRNRREVIDSVHPDDRERVFASFRSHLDGETELYRAEFRSRTASGAWKWLLAVGRVVERSSDGAPLRMVGTHTDIDERVQAEQRIAASLREKEMLLREIHHRVKNNLQVIASLIHFQSKRIPGAEAAATFADLRQRIYAMTLVHERLYQSIDVARVDLREYVISLVNELTRSFEPRPGVRIDVESDEVLLPIEDALPCGMLLCELVTNVLKYAFPGRSSGLARVRIARRGNEIELSVSDNGVGLPASVTPASGGAFGWELVRMLALQLAAAIEVENSGGACVRVRFAATDPAGCYS